mgnify:CR=1 FL=1
MWAAPTPPFSPTPKRGILRIRNRNNHVGTQLPSTVSVMPSFSLTNAHIRVFLLFTAGYFLSYFFRSANAIIAPDLTRELGLTADQLGFMTSIFFATFALAQIPIGIGLDWLGPRWITPALFLIAIGGALLFAGGSSLAMLATARALIGIGMAGALVGALKMFSQWFPPQQFATVSGILVGIGSMGALVAATPLAAFSAAFGWRSVFLVGAAITFVMAVAIMLFTRNYPPGTAPASTGGVSVSGVLQVVQSRAFWQIAPLNLFAAGMLLAFQGLWAGPYLYDALQMDAVQVGNRLLLLSGSATIGYIASGWLAHRFGLTQVIVVGCGMFALIQAILALRPDPFWIAPLYALYGFTGTASILLLTHTRQIYPSTITGQAITAVNVFGIGGTFVLQWGIGLIISTYPQVAPSVYPPEAYSTALFITAALSLLALGWYLPLAYHTARTTPTEQV